ncbi:hypothetical protein NT2_04_00060 [Caenibius tardaugens NBRC 16725]|uniref:DUF2269 domain-containing protein n=1 Tax=Caenibius tardaugens NBRC 16725 TaxID=1219035 RepID=U2YJH5_9SPHN|nr:DUF2269 domain-containing protein [Caenibius tardaugens]AZI36289.1 DUF2269 domain-containing protein [Caenibius tardaugens NBRC 16725]GAD48595.1 hypothetical protein NT2_04_00060 [Caenibius tardaugens NBRC 16725]
MEAYLLVKWLHIVSSTVLFGFGAGTAWYLWNAHLTGDAALIAKVGRMVVKADWIFTGTSGVVQPASGLVLIKLAGYSLIEPWLLATYVLYVIAFACWVPVVWLQIKAQRLAQQAAESGTVLGADYRRAMRQWFVLGWPAFIGLTTVFWLMVAKPALW